MGGFLLEKMKEGDFAAPTDVVSAILDSKILTPHQVDRDQIERGDKIVRDLTREDLVRDFVRGRGYYSVAYHIRRGAIDPKYARRMALENKC